MKQKDPNGHTVSTVVEALASLAQRDPMAVTHELMGEPQDWTEMANNAANHVAVTLAYAITHPGRKPGGHASAAAALTAALAVKQVRTWMSENREQGEAAEKAISQLLKNNACTEEDFDRRTSEENFQAVNELGYQLPELTDKLIAPPAETIDGLEIIVRHASRQEEELRAALGRSPGLYMNDSHYDQFQTFTWAWILAKAARNSISKT